MCHIQASLNVQHKVTLRFLSTARLQPVQTKMHVLQDEYAADFEIGQSKLEQDITDMLQVCCCNPFLA